MIKSDVEVINNFLSSDIMLNKSDSTVRTYRNVLGKYVEWLSDNGGSLRDLTRTDVQAYVKALENGGKEPSTVDKVYATIRVFSRYIGRPDVVNGVSKRKRQHVTQTAPDSLSGREVLALLRDIERDGRNKGGNLSVTGMRNLAIVRTLLETGLRVSELCDAKISDVTLNERSGHITVTGKGDKVRTIPLAKETRKAITDYLAVRNDDNPALFVSNYGKPISVRSVQRLLNKYGTHPHSLRHTFCTRLARKGIDIVSIAELAGHSDLNVTRRYSKPTREQLAEAIDKAFS